MEDIMPTIKRSLTRPEKLDHLARAKQMRAEGVDLRIREEWLEAAHSMEMKAARVDVEIPQRPLEKSRRLDIFVAGGPATFIFDMPGGGAAFAIWVRLVARRLVTLLDWAMTTAWDDQIVPQAFFDERTELWRLGQKDFPRSDVLNMRMHAFTLNPGRMVEGWLLAVGLYPMPEAFHHGMTVPFTLELWDQYENVIPQDAELFVDRTCKPKNNFVRRESDLYSPDQTSAIIESAFRPNLNRGPVPHPAQSPNPAAREEGESEVTAMLRKALGQLSHADDGIQQVRFCPKSNDGLDGARRRARRNEREGSGQPATNRMKTAR
jgi:hypothetical protein